MILLTALQFKDYNRSIDLTMLPEEAEFDAKASNKSLLCCEMLNDKPWTYQVCTHLVTK